MTSDPEKRFEQHFNGTGAKWTQKHEPVEVNSLMKCKSKESASKAEKIIYENMRDYHGQNKVRGAYYTKST